MRAADDGLGVVDSADACHASPPAVAVIAQASGGGVVFGLLAGGLAQVLGARGDVHAR
jgi:hypothetical protein